MRHTLRSTPRPTALFATAALLATAAGLAAACGPMDTAAHDASADAASPPVDAAPEPADGPAGACDPGPVPAGVAPLTSRFVILGADEPFPSPAGGDPMGPWIVRRVTQYLPAQAQGRVDASASTIEGTGWASFSAAGFQIALELQLRVVTTVVGPVRQGVSVASEGQFRADGAELALTPTCARGTQTVDRVGVTRDDATHARLFVTVPGDAMRGTSVMVLDVERGS